MIMTNEKEITIYNVRPTLASGGYERSDYPPLALAAELRRFRGARDAGGVSPSEDLMHFCWEGGPRCGGGLCPPRGNLSVTYDSAILKGRLDIGAGLYLRTYHLVPQKFNID